MKKVDYFNVRRKRVLFQRKAVWGFAKGVTVRTYTYTSKTVIKKNGLCFTCKSRNAVKAHGLRIISLSRYEYIPETFFLTVFNYFSNQFFAHTHSLKGRQDADIVDISHRLFGVITWKHVYGSSSDYFAIVHRCKNEQAGMLKQGCEMVFLRRLEILYFKNKRENANQFLKQGSIFRSKQFDVSFQNSCFN